MKDVDKVNELSSSSLLYMSLNHFGPCQCLRSIWFEGDLAGKGTAGRVSIPFLFHLKYVAYLVFTSE